MERQSSSDNENKMHENDPSIASYSSIFEPASLAAKVMASCPESPIDQEAMALRHDPESLNDERKLSLSDAGNPEQFKHPSPTMKKKGKSTNTDGNGRKGCKCKKSQCLKLYCDCFAAGIFCTDPCSCQGCLNRPEYEDTVLETKKRVESRDPHAFLPKVVPQSTALASNKDNMEGANVVTASRSRARHKKGCNCKKSLCQKEYCDCYRAKVGCWNDCKCEGCKNVYGSGTIEDYVRSAHALPLSKERESINKTENGLKDLQCSASPCSSTGSSDIKEWTNILQSQECLYCPGSPIIPRNSVGEKEYVEPLGSDLDNTQRFLGKIVPASTNHNDHLQQMWLTMENPSCNTNTPSTQVIHSPRPGNEPHHEGLVLQPQLYVPWRQQLLSQNIENHIAPQPNLVPPVSSLLAQNPSQNIGQNYYVFTGSKRQMPGMQQHQFVPQQFQQFFYQLQQPNQWQPSMVQASSLPSLILEQPINNVQHSTNQFMFQQRPLAMSHQREQQQSSIVHQQQTPVNLTQQPMLHVQQQHQLMGPQSNATNIQVQAHMLGPPNNGGDIEEPRRLLSQQNNLTNLLSQFPPSF